MFSVQQEWDGFSVTHNAVLQTKQICSESNWYLLVDIVCRDYDLCDKIFTFHRHQMRAAKIIRPKSKLTTMMKTFTSVEGFWVKRASTTTWKCTTHDIWASVTSKICRGLLLVWLWIVSRGFYLCYRLSVDEDGVRIFSGIWHLCRALNPHDTVATLRQRSKQTSGVYLCADQLMLVLTQVFPLWISFYIVSTEQ